MFSKYTIRRVADVQIAEGEVWLEFRGYSGVSGYLRVLPPGEALYYGAAIAAATNPNQDFRHQSNEVTVQDIELASTRVSHTLQVVNSHIQLTACGTVKLKHTPMSIVHNVIN